MQNPINHSPEIVIRVENLSKSYHSIKAVDGISFQVRKGEIFGFLGPNGAGKTTTLSILEGLQKPDSGSANILGMDVNTHTQAVKRRIGVQLQSTSLLPDLTVLEQVQLFSRLYGYKHGNGEIPSLLQLVGLEQKTGELPDNLSGGQQQRLAIALALINQPEIIFLDEPTTGLDPQSRRALWEIIRQLQAQEKTIVLTTHYMEEAEALCDRIAIIDHGRLAALDSPGSLINHLDDIASITTSSYLPIDKLKSLACIHHVQRNGTHLHMQTRDVVTALRNILDLAEQNHANLHALYHLDTLYGWR